MGYIEEIELVNSYVFIPQRRFRLWMVFMRKDAVSGLNVGVSAFRFCTPSVTSHVGVSELSRFLDVSGGCCQAAAPPPKALQPLKELTEHAAQLKWPKHTARFLKKNSLDKKVMAYCMSGLQKQQYFSKLSAREQRLLLAHYAYAIQCRKQLGWLWVVYDVYVALFSSLLKAPDAPAERK